MSGPFKSMRAAGLSALSLSLASCAYYDPYVLPTTSGSCTKDPKPTSCAQLPSVSNAVDKITTSVKDVSEKLNHATHTSRVLNLTTFGLVTGLAVRTAQGASTNSIRNLGLAAGSAYAGSVLFTPPSTESSYLTAHASLSCLADRGNALLSGYDTAKVGFEANDKVASDLQILAPEPCKKAGDNALNGAVSSTITARNEARAALARAVALDRSAGTRLATAADNVLIELNRQLLKQSPSLEAIEKSGRSVSAMMTGALASASTPSDTQKAVPTATTVKECGPGVTPESLANLKSAYEGIRDSINAQINAIGDLSSGCAQAEILPTASLSPSQAVVDLSPNYSFNIVVSGGRPPYTAGWVGEEPDAKTLTKDLPAGSNVLRLAEGSEGKEKTYTIRVKDAAVVPSTVDITVKTHPAGR